jgi:hypothetical protein
MRARQIEMQRRSRPQVIAKLAAIELHHSDPSRRHRDHQRPRQMLVPRLAEHPEPLQAAAKISAPA